MGWVILGFIIAQAISIFIIVILVLVRKNREVKETAGSTKKKIQNKKKIAQDIKEIEDEKDKISTIDDDIDRALRVQDIARGNRKTDRN